MVVGFRHETIFNAASKTYANFKSCQKRIKNNNIALLVQIRDTCETIKMP